MKCFCDYLPLGNRKIEKRQSDREADFPLAISPIFLSRWLIISELTTLFVLLHFASDLLHNVRHF